VATIAVTTQAELDTALAKHGDDDDSTIVIDSPAGVWMELEASGSATVEAYGFATVRAYGFATVEASGSATVRAYGSATVRASGSATVQAYDSATVQAYDSATVQASTHVAVRLYSARATVIGGVLIDVSGLDSASIDHWVDYTGCETTPEGDLLVYKALRDSMKTGHEYGHPVSWPTSGVVECDDWKDNHQCGHGLHVSPHPHVALGYDNASTRMLKCVVARGDARTIGWDKLKAPRLTVLCEVTLTGGPMPEAVEL